MLSDDVAECRAEVEDLKQKKLIYEHEYYKCKDRERELRKKLGLGEKPDAAQDKFDVYLSCEAQEEWLKSLIRVTDGILKRAYADVEEVYYPDKISWGTEDRDHCENRVAYYREQVVKRINDLELRVANSAICSDKMLEQLRLKKKQCDADKEANETGKGKGRWGAGETQNCRKYNNLRIACGNPGRLEDIEEIDETQYPEGCTDQEIAAIKKADKELVAGRVAVVQGDTKYNNGKPPDLATLERNSNMAWNVCLDRVAQESNSCLSEAKKEMKNVCDRCDHLSAQAKKIGGGSFLEKGDAVRLQKTCAQCARLRYQCGGPKVMLLYESQILDGYFKFTADLIEAIDHIRKWDSGPSGQGSSTHSGPAEGEAGPSRPQGGRRRSDDDNDGGLLHKKRGLSIKDHLKELDGKLDLQKLADDALFAQITSHGGADPFSAPNASFHPVPALVNAELDRVKSLRSTFDILLTGSMSEIEVALDSVSSSDALGMNNDERDRLQKQKATLLSLQAKSRFMGDSEKKMGNQLRWQFQQPGRNADKVYQARDELLAQQRESVDFCTKYTSKDNTTAPVPAICGPLKVWDLIRDVVDSPLERQLSEGVGKPEKGFKPLDGGGNS